MRIEINCSECSRQMAPGEARTVYSRLCAVCEDGVYEFECPNGHRTCTVLRTPKHEVLFTIAANAILDGYFRDAVASFAASLEKYYEFVLRVMARRNKVKPVEFEKTWDMLNRSERQFGAVVIAWLMETGERHTPTPRRMTELRNHVVHQGQIPSNEECKEYGQSVLNTARPMEEILLDRYGAEHKEECFAKARDVEKSKSSPLTVLSIFSAFDRARENDWKLEPALKELEDYRKHIESPIIGTECGRSRTLTRVPPNQ